MRHHVLALAALSLCAVLLSACQTTFVPGTTAHGVAVIAHRGASAYAPENTLAAFRLAHTMGADWFELDCMLSKDGEVIVIHDRDFERTTGVAQPVNALTLDEIRALDAGSWFDAQFAGEPVPTLGESLDFARGRIGVYVEIKDSDDDRALLARLLDMIEGEDELTPALRGALMQQVTDSGTRNLALTRRAIDAIRRREMERQVVIQSFSPVVCLVALSEAPEIRTEMLGSESRDDPEHWPRLVRFARFIRAHGFNAHHDSLTPERIAAFHDAGMTVAAWTVNDPERMRQLVDWGVDGIITDKPDVCRAVLEQGAPPVSAVPARNPAAVGMR